MPWTKTWAPRPDTSGNQTNPTGDSVQFTKMFYFLMGHPEIKKENKVSGFVKASVFFRDNFLPGFPTCQHFLILNSVCFLDSVKLLW